MAIVEERPGVTRDRKELVAEWGVRFETRMGLNTGEVVAGDAPAQLFERHPRCQGGFVWEWIDHGLRTRTADGVEFFAYGGDFGDVERVGWCRTDDARAEVLQRTSATPRLYHALALRESSTIARRYCSIALR